VSTLVTEAAYTTALDESLAETSHYGWIQPAVMISAPYENAMMLVTINFVALLASIQIAILENVHDWTGGLPRDSAKAVVDLETI
jgi:hypothetical protein